MIKAIRVDWREGWGNSARLDVLFDKLPPDKEMLYEERDNIYLATKGGCASFWAYKGPDDDCGCASREWDIPMKDGSTVTLKGPWASNSQAVNEAFGGELVVMEASVTDDPNVFERGYTFCSMSVTVSAVLDYIKANPDCGFKIGLVTTVGGTYYLPVRPDGTSKDPKDVVIYVCEKVCAGIEIPEELK